MTSSEIQQAVFDACRDTIRQMLGNITSSSGGGGQTQVVVSGPDAVRLNLLEDRVDTIDDSLRDLLLRSEISTEREQSCPAYLNTYRHSFRL